jgi:hypothetical protein
MAIRSVRRTRGGPLLRAAEPVVLLALTALLPGCAGLGGSPRPATSFAGCARAAVEAVVTDGMTDKQKHCTGAASIAALCSVAEARLAAYGKELRDALGNGDADPEDLAADRAGIECARRDPAADAVRACCAAAGY